MSRSIFKLPQNYLKFFKTNRNGDALSFRWELVPEHRWKEFADFVNNYYVKYEITHVVAGIHKQPEAMEEYKQITLKHLKDPAYLPLICCVENENNYMSAIDVVRLYKKGDVYSDIEPAKTEGVKRFFHILHEWNELCPVPKVMEKYGVETFFEDAGLAVHPKYRGFAFSKDASLIRGMICKENNVPMTGAWHTSVATQKGSDRQGWETVYEIGYKDLEKILKVTFHEPPPTFQYKVKKI